MAFHGKLAKCQVVQNGTKWQIHLLLIILDRNESILTSWLQGFMDICQL